MFIVLTRNKRSTVSQCPHVDMPSLSVDKPVAPAATNCNDFSGYFCIDIEDQQLKSVVCISFIQIQINNHCSLMFLT